MKKILIYYPFPLRKSISGSAVRANKMIEAFSKFAKERNLELIKVVGSSSERKKIIKSIYKSIDPRDVLFCYVESSTLPLWLTDNDHIPRHPFVDWKFLRYLKKNNIPIGLFYRDIYWKFNDHFPFKGLTRWIMKILYRIELAIFKKYVDRFFLPSIEMNKYLGLSENIIITLPPGGELLVNQIEKKIGRDDEILNVIYVGGINKRDGLDLLLETFDKVNKDNILAKLYLVCREKDYKVNKNTFKPYVKKTWLKVLHAYGEHLKPIYENADIAIIPRRRTVYNNFAVPVKLFEYISYGLPIIATNCEAQARIIKEFQLGIIVKDNSEALADGIRYFLDKNKLLFYKKSVNKALRENHLWAHRVQKVYLSLINMKDSP